MASGGAPDKKKEENTVVDSEGEERERERERIAFHFDGGGGNVR